MAQKTEIRFIDDLDGSDAIGTVEFALDGKDYQIDLSEANAARLRDALVDFVGAARRAPRGPRAGGRRGGGSGGNVAPLPASAKRQQTQAIREWASQRGHTVAERGRIPRTVVEAYEAENGPLAPQFSGVA